MRIPSPCLVVLIGPSGSGKSTWAAANFGAGQVVSADALRQVAGEGPDDLDASDDAFELLDSIVERRLARHLATVVDTLGFDAERRRRWLDAAARHGVPSHAVLFRTSGDECLRRNRARRHPIPPAVIARQLKTFAATAIVVAEEGFVKVHDAGDVEVSRPDLVEAAERHTRQRRAPVGLGFGLHLPRYTWAGGREATPSHLRSIAARAEQAGFGSIWVMDHFLQIPQVGREWEDMLESWTTLGYLAALTTSVELGTLVSGVTYRNVAHLAKIAATLDVLSGGRAVCGIGAAWFEREHRAYGYPFPPAAERLDLLEDALRLLPLMWGPGSPSFDGLRISVPEAVCYPRPVRGTIPVLVGGGGERRTLALAARYADACNVMGAEAVVRHKAAVLARHCAAAGRDPADVAFTHLSTAVVAGDRRGLEDAVDRLRPRGVPAEAYARRVNAATVADHIGRFRGLADAGVQQAIVSLPDVEAAGTLETFGDVISAFR